MITAMTTEQYETVCKKEFYDIRQAQKETTDAVVHLTKKLFHSNGERALVEVIRDNTEGRKRLESEVAALKKAPVTGKSELFEKDGEHGEIELSKRGLILKGVPPSDMVKILLMGMILLQVLDNRYHIGAKVAELVFGQQPAVAAQVNP